MNIEECNCPSKICNEFEQVLASRVNIIWQDLTEEEKQQIKEILK